jgi:hypothetical protein
LASPDRPTPSDPHEELLDEELALALSRVEVRRALLCRVLRALHELGDDDITRVAEYAEGMGDRFG